MRLTVEIAHKIGLPNYGSSSSTVGIALDVPEDLADALGKNPARLRNQLAALQALARGLVEHDLALIAANAQAAADENPQPTVTRPARPTVEPTTETDDDGRPQPVRLKPTPGRFEDQPQNGRPRNGKQLYPWAKKQEEAGVAGLVKRLAAYGKGEGFPDRMVDWSQEQTREVLNAIMTAARN
jgi:hypothetical protein